MKLSELKNIRKVLKCPMGNRYMDLIVYEIPYQMRSYYGCNLLIKIIGDSYRDFEFEKYVINKVNAVTSEYHLERINEKGFRDGLTVKFWSNGIEACFYQD
jgi:hypothetical protein